MKYKVLGPRILLEVPKVTKEKYYPGTQIVMPEDTAEMEQSAQTVGKVVQIGNTAYKNRYDGSQEEMWVKEGDLVHFQRYGAVRLKSEKSDSIEQWIVNDTDILAIESN